MIDIDTSKLTDAEKDIWLAGYNRGLAEKEALKRVLIRIMDNDDYESELKNQEKIDF